MRKTYSKIADIIGASVRAIRPYSMRYEGSYLLTSDGQYFATDGRRIVSFKISDAPDVDVIIDHDGDEWDAENYKEKFTNCMSMNDLEVIYDWNVDLGSLIVENGWMNAKANTLDKVTFKTVFNHYRKNDTSKVINEEHVTLNHFNVRFIADILRVYRALHKNRTKSMVVNMKFTRAIGQYASACHIEAVDGSFKFVVMPILEAIPSEECQVDVIEVPTKNLF